jgi:hypothetical protein
VHHLASLRHRSCPPGRSWPRGDAVFQVFVDAFSDMLQAHVSSVWRCGCCKSRLGCCICYNDCTRMLQASIPNVLSFLHVCCKCFRCMFQVFHIFFYVLQMLHLYVSKVYQDVAHVAMVFELYVPNVLSVLDVCCKGFILILQKWIGVLHGLAGGVAVWGAGWARGRGSLQWMRAWVLEGKTQDAGREAGCGRGSGRCQSLVPTQRPIRTSGC